MQAFLMPNLDKEHAPYCTKTSASVLAACGVLVLIEPQFSALVNSGDVSFVSAEEGLLRCDILIAIGGDGTMLHCSKAAVRYDKPMLGVNAGRLGFMTGIEADQLNALSRLVTGEYRTDTRMMLDCVHHAGGASSRYLALNDIVVSNGGLSRMIDVDLSSGEAEPIAFRADGIILSTPTGSTAYALSAGGPVIEPSVDCIGVTAICPHSLYARPVLFSAEKVLFVQPSPQSRCSVYLTVDGDQGARLNAGDYVEVRRSEKRLRLLSLNEGGFYETLRRKFKI